MRKPLSTSRGGIRSGGRYTAKLTATLGAVVRPHVMKAGREDRDEAAVKLMQTWTLEPANCKGKAKTVQGISLCIFSGIDGFQRQRIENNFFHRVTKDLCCYAKS